MAEQMNEWMNDMKLNEMNLDNASISSFQITKRNK